MPEVVPQAPAGANVSGSPERVIIPGDEQESFRATILGYVSS